MISRDQRPESLQEQIADDIRLLIKSGVFSGRIPSEPKLEEMYGVSRVTIRGAISILTEANIVKPVRGRGTYIIGKP